MCYYSEVVIFNSLSSTFTFIAFSVLPYYTAFSIKFSSSFLTSLLSYFIFLIGSFFFTGIYPRHWSHLHDFPHEKQTQ